MLKVLFGIRWFGSHTSFLFHLINAFGEWSTFFTRYSRRYQILKAFVLYFIGSNCKRTTPNDMLLNTWTFKSIIAGTIPKTNSFWIGLLIENSAPIIYLGISPFQPLFDINNRHMWSIQQRHIFNYICLTCAKRV